MSFTFRHIYGVSSLEQIHDPKREASTCQYLPRIMRGLAYYDLTNSYCLYPGTIFKCDGCGLAWYLQWKPADPNVTDASDPAQRQAFWQVHTHMTNIAYVGQPAPEGG